MTQLTLVISDKSDWLNHYDPQGSGVFVPTAEDLAVNAKVRIDVRFENGPRLVLHGAVVWRRAETDAKIPAGVGVTISSSDSEKINYLNGFVRGGLLDLRELRRLPLKLKVRFENAASGGKSRSGVTRDINEEGMFVYTPHPCDHGEKTTFILTAPEGGQDSVVEGVITYVMDEEDGGPGMGLKFDFDDGAQYARHVERVKAWEVKLLNGSMPDEAIE